MKINLNMPARLYPFYKKEIQIANTYLQNGNLQLCWHHFERAHIIGQPYPLQHTFVHWQMLKFGIKIKSKKEIIGQITRLVFGGIKSFVGTIPTGNTGGANVPPLKKMGIPKDIKAIIGNNL